MLNKISNENEKSFAEENLNRIGLEILGCIPYDSEVSVADMKREPLVNYENSKAQNEIRKISEKIMNLKN